MAKKMAIDLQKFDNEFEVTLSLVDFYSIIKKGGLSKNLHFFKDLDLFMHQLEDDINNQELLETEQNYN